MEQGILSLDDLVNELNTDPEFVKEDRKLSPYYQLAQAIYLRRKKLILSQKELAKKANTYQYRISKLEQGEGNPRLSTIIEIADSLGCSIDIRMIPCDEPELYLFTPSGVITTDSEDPINLEIHTNNAKISL